MHMIRVFLTWGPVGVGGWGRAAIAWGEAGAVPGFSRSVAELCCGFA